MAAHRKAFPTPRGAHRGVSPRQRIRGAPPRPPGDGKSDPKGGVARLLDVVARCLWCMYTKARRAPSRKPRNAVVWAQFS